MKALTIRQPFASLVVWGVKTWETRHWTTTHRGPLLIHAGRFSQSMSPTMKCLIGMDAQQFLDKVLKNTPWEGTKYFDLPTQAIIGSVDVASIFRITDELTAKVSVTDQLSGYWSNAYFAWKLENPKSFHPIPALGCRGLWEYAATCNNLHFDKRSA